MELPIRKAILDKTKKGHGLKLISLVNQPAIGFVPVKMSENQNFKLSIINEEERIIFTPVLIPDQLIYRNLGGQEFNLTFDAPTIKEIAIYFAENLLANKADINHSEKLIDGVVWFESFVLSDKRVKSVVGFEGLPIGTWFVSGKVNDDSVWDKIKSGEIQGVSIDGVFDAMLIQQSAQIDLTDSETEFITDYILSNF